MDAPPVVYLTIISKLELWFGEGRKLCGVIFKGFLTFVTPHDDEKLGITNHQKQRNVIYGLSLNARNETSFFALLLILK